eukprot:SM000035S13151  [mRNA]  locus=s35:789176:794102:- [translate_table: standard]
MLARRGGERGVPDVLRGSWHWSQEVPEGREDCLADLTFVITGTLDSMEREEAEQLIKRHGGRITGSVSKKTSYLVADEHVGGRKAQKAAELGVPVLSEDGLFDLIRASGPPKTKKVSSTTQQSAKTLPSQRTKLPTGRLASAAPKSEVAGAAAEADTWPQRFAPQSTEDIVANQSHVKTLREWLENWASHHLGGHAVNGKNKGKALAGAASSGPRKAVLLAGPPGVGKTTVARLVCAELGFTALEVNASDSRGKADASVAKGIGGRTANAVKEMVSNEALQFARGADSRQHKAVLIMDEVDGMSAGDRGGIADLILSIRVSRIPIVCICNDRHSPKLRSLANHTLVLPFRKPTKQQMAKRLRHVADQECLAVDDVTLEELGEHVNGDMRMALNQLQYMSLRTRELKLADMQHRLAVSAKDEDVSPFIAADRLLAFDSGKLRMEARIDAAMTDMGLENYLNYRPGELSGKDEKGTLRMDMVSAAADSIAQGDCVERQVRRYQQWQLAQSSAFFASIIPAAKMHGARETFFPGERNFNRFAGWFGKNSTFGKNVRLLEDVHIHMVASCHCEPPREVVRLDYAPVLTERFTRPLKLLPKDEGARVVADLLDDYSLTLEDMDTLLSVSKFRGKEQPMDGVVAATKAQLTRVYRSRAPTRAVRLAELLPELKLPKGISTSSKKRKRPPLVASLEPLPGDEEGEAADLLDADDEDEEDEDEEASAANGGAAPLLSSRVGENKMPGRSAKGTLMLSTLCRLQARQPATNLLVAVVVGVLATADLLVVIEVAAVVVAEASMLRNSLYNRRGGQRKREKHTLLHRPMLKSFVHSKASRKSKCSVVECTSVPYAVISSSGLLALVCASAAGLLAKCENAQVLLLVQLTRQPQFMSRCKTKA